MRHSEDPWLNRPGGPYKKLLDCIEEDIPVGYFTIREMSGLSGEALDKGLAGLEELGLIQSKGTGTQVFYWRKPQQPRKFWYTIDEAADHMSVSKRTVQQLIRDGDLATYRVGKGGHRRIKWEDLDSAMVPDRRTDAEALVASDDAVLAELWDNDQDSVYDQL